MRVQPPTTEPHPSAVTRVVAAPAGPAARATAGAVLALALLLLLLLLPSRALAQTYSDVPSTCWAHDAIGWVTDYGPADDRLMDDYDGCFKPEGTETRAQFARALVVAAGHQGETVTPVQIADVVPDVNPYYWDIELAVHYGYLNLTKGMFKPDAAVKASTAEAAIVRWLKEKYTTASWTLLTALKPADWEPVDGWKTGAPGYLPYVVASRQLGLRFNHSTSGDAHEVTPSQAIDRAEIAYMFRRAFAASGTWQLSGLSRYASVTFPALSDRQEQVVKFALKYVGYPYIWGGEWPTKASPYGAQKAGGFDCSGFTFYVMQLHFGYNVAGRGAGDQARLATTRISRANLKCGDLIFFGDNGTKSSVSSIYHAALYLGNGWFIHSTGSSDGVTLCYLNDGGYWQSHFAWGRRLLKKSELVVAQ